MRQSVLALFVALSCLAGCGSGGDATPDPGVTYYGDLSHVLNARCVSCHHTGGIAPFPLDTYEAATTWAASMRYAVVNRDMPPWPIRSDGSCQTYQDARYLTADEQAVFGLWMDGGMLEGDPANGAAPWVPPPGLGADALELTIPEPYTPSIDPSSGYDDDYRCFPIDPGIDADMFVEQFEIVPGDERMVHHVIVYSVDPNQVVGSVDGDSVTNAEVMDGLEAQYPGLGWSCFSLAGDGVIPNGLPATWTPGTGVTAYPSDTGIRLRADDVLVMQVHYNLENGAGPDQTTLRLQLDADVLREGVVLLYDGLLETSFEGEPFVIPAGQPSTEFSWEMSFDRFQALIKDNGGPDVTEVELLGVFPHMHTLARSMRVEMEGTTGTCLADVPDWDFHWQQFYFYEEPVLFREGETVRITCDYDTTSRSDDVYPGYGTSNEMCLFGAYLTLPVDLPF